MSRKKLEVVELNKKKEEIILEEETSALILFWRRNRGIILSLLLVLALLVFGISLFLFIKNLNSSDEPTIKKTSIDISLSDDDVNFGTDNAFTNDSAKEAFKNNKKKGQVLLVKKIETSNYTIKFFSDGMALKIMKDGKTAVKINPLDDGNYGISDAGILNSKATITNLTVTKTNKYPWGTVTYFSDGSADITNSKMDMFVRNNKDINDTYISDNKVSYLKETKNIGNVKLNYYHDGTI